MVITPTVGRKVWFHAGQDHSEMNVINSDQPLDATVLYVHDDHTININVVDHMGHEHFVEKAPLVQPGELTADDSYVVWMPFQVDQAKKHAEPPTS